MNRGAIPKMFSKFDIVNMQRQIQRRRTGRAPPCLKNFKGVLLKIHRSDTLAFRPNEGYIFNLSLCSHLYTKYMYMH